MHHRENILFLVDVILHKVSALKLSALDPFGLFFTTKYVVNTFDNAEVKSPNNHVENIVAASRRLVCRVSLADSME